MTTAAELRSIIEGNPRRGVVKPPKKKLPAAAKRAFADIADAETDGDRKVAAAFKATKRAYETFLKDTTGSAWRVKAGEDLLSMSGPDGQAIDIYWDWDAMFNKADITVEGPGRKMTKKKLSLAALTKQGGKSAATELLLKNLGENVEEFLAPALRENDMDLASELRGIIEGRTAKTYYDLKKGDRAFGGLITDIDPGRGAGRTFSVEYPDRVERINITNPGQRISSKDRKGMKLREAAKGSGATRAQAQKPHGWSRKEKKTHTKKQVRKSKKAEIKRQLRGEDIEAALQILIDEGIDDFAELLEREQGVNLERPLNMLVSEANAMASLGLEIERWATNALREKQMDLRTIQALSRLIEKTGRKVKGAIGRFLSAAAIGEDIEEDRTPEDRAVLALDKKFRLYMKALTGKPAPTYHDILKALMDQGLDRKVAGQYALFATEKLAEGMDDQYDDLSSNEDGVRAPDPGRRRNSPDFDGEHEGITPEAAAGAAVTQTQAWPVNEGCGPDCDCEECKAKGEHCPECGEKVKGLAQHMKAKHAEESLSSELWSIIRG